MRYAIGIDIGGTTTQLGIAGEDGSIYHPETILTNRHEPFEKFFPRLKKKISEIIDKSEFEIEGIGIGAPNGNYLRGTIEHPANLSWEGVTPAGEMIEKEFGMETALTNDANAAAVGEMLFGAARGMKNFIMITLGTGLGSGIIVEGNLLYGATGFAGEMGHVTVALGGRQSPFGRLGSLEAYVSATGIVETVKETRKLRELDIFESPLRDIPEKDLSSKIIFEEAEKGDPLAITAFDFTGDILGRAFANTALLFSPEAFIIGGGMANASKFFLNRTRKSMEENLIPVFLGTIEIKISELLDRNSAILGAGALILQK